MYNSSADSKRKEQSHPMHSINKKRMTLKKKYANY